MRVHLSHFSRKTYFFKRTFYLKESSSQLLENKTILQFPQILEETIVESSRSIFQVEKNK